MVAAGNALIEYGCTISSIVAAVEKTNYGGCKRIKKELGVMPRVLFQTYNDSQGEFRVKKCASRKG